MGGRGVRGGGFGCGAQDSGVWGDGCWHRRNKAWFLAAASFIQHGGMRGGFKEEGGWGPPRGSTCGTRGAGVGGVGRGLLHAGVRRRGVEECGEGKGGALPASKMAPSGSPALRRVRWRPPPPEMAAGKVSRALLQDGGTQRRSQRRRPKMAARGGASRPTSARLRHGGSGAARCACAGLHGETRGRARTG